MEGGDNNGLEYDRNRGDIDRKTEIERYIYLDFGRGVLDKYKNWEL